MKRQEKIIILRQYKKILEFVKEEQTKNKPTYDKPKVKVLNIMGKILKLLKRRNYV